MGQSLSMRFMKVADYDALSSAAAKHIRAAALSKPDFLFCAASGDTPSGTYRELAKDPQSFADMRVLKLDEWGDLDADHPAACENYLRKHLLAPLAVEPERFEGFRGNAPDAVAECARVDAWLAKHGPIDLCLLGLGRNGHLALNEPAEALEAASHVSSLAEISRTHPMLEHAGGQVSHGLTLGMAGIMQSREILLLVSGEHKQRPLADLMSRHISSQAPASFLWLHAHSLCICDAAALGSTSLPDA